MIMGQVDNQVMYSSTVHEQVKKQLEYLKYLVDGENEREENCKQWGIPYEPSRTKADNIYNYRAYKNHIEKYGDKNLLVMVDMDDPQTKHNLTIYGVKPFARRYIGEEYLIHRIENGGDLLFIESKVKVIK